MLRPLALLVAVPTLALAADHIGAETCKACHPLAYEAWKEGPHARALEGLGEAQRADARCTSCHAPDAERGVTCETCHGGGKLYAHEYVMRDRELARAVGLQEPSERTCLACHTESTPSLTRFEYARKLRLIEHGGDRAARQGGGARARGAPGGR